MHTSGSPSPEAYLSYNGGLRLATVKMWCLELIGKGLALAISQKGLLEPISITRNCFLIYLVQDVVQSLYACSFPLFKMETFPSLQPGRDVMSPNEIM